MSMYHAEFLHLLNRILIGITQFNIYKIRRKNKVSRRSTKFIECIAKSYDLILGYITFLIPFYLFLRSI